MRTIFLSSLVVLITSSGFAQTVPPIVSPLQPTVVTQGTAIVTARPDRAFVTIAAESRSKNSSEAQKQNAAAMTAVLQKIEQSGVSKDAVRTIGYELRPEFDYANGRQTFRSYLARNTVEVRLDDIDRIGLVIDSAAAGGATTITGIRLMCVIAQRWSAMLYGRPSPTPGPGPMPLRQARVQQSIASFASKKAVRRNRRGP